MSLQSWQQTLISSQIDGTPITNSAVAASIIPPAAKYTLPANTLSIGSTLRVTLLGRISNVVTTPGTLTIDFRLGGTVVFNGGAQQMSTTVHTNEPFLMTMYMTCRVIGAAANLMGQAVGQSQCFASTAVTDNTYTHASVMMPNTAPAVGNNFDSTTALVADVFGTFSVNTATTSITVHQYFLELLN